MHMLIIKTAADVHLFAASKEYRKNARAEFLKVVHNYVNGISEELTWNEIWNYIPDNFWASYGLFPVIENGQGPYNLRNYDCADFSIVTIDGNEIINPSL